MLSELPEHLACRVRRLNEHEPSEGDVVYWMRTALRAEDNPALEVAAQIARDLNKNFWVYLGLSERYRYASDRHHYFILEGFRDVAAALAQRGIAAAVHVERPGHRERVLDVLGQRAGVLLTEEMPVSPLRLWTRKIADSALCPVLAVDTATVVPMRVVGHGIDRAYTYRARIQPLMDRFLSPTPPVSPGASTLPDLPFAPVDLETADLGELIASAEIDHTIPRVRHTPGGSTAGYARWDGFKARLGNYARTRNDPLLDGTSRMSAYLHMGMVSPVRLAREARAIGGRGADKFVDELVVWRELAHTWCLYHRDHESLDSLPEWAGSTLRAHASDPRGFTPSSEALELGKTGETLWDIAQQSLVRWGELHNNVRMTWGKALLHWSKSPQIALRRLVDLNHRYALDGRDPASYGGLLWCLGLFDRPFPEQPVWGTVRSRSVPRHEKRLNTAAWAARIQRPREVHVSIVGAGLAGSFLGRILHEHGVRVTLYDKGRGAGGRCSSRRGDDVRFSHGAPALDITDRRLDRWVQGWLDAGALEETNAQGRYRSVPANALVKHLQRGLDVRFGQRIETLSTLEGDIRVTTAPAPQSVDLLGAHSFAAELTTVEYHPCWAVMVEFDTPTTPEPHPAGTWSGAGRAWVLHGSPEWSRERIEADPEAVIAAAAIGAGARKVSAHRWRYANLARGLDADCLFDGEVGVAGDLFAAGQANGALTSAAALAGRILR